MVNIILDEVRPVSAHHLHDTGIRSETIGNNDIKTTRNTAKKYVYQSENFLRNVVTILKENMASFALVEIVGLLLSSLIVLVHAVKSTVIITQFQTPDQQFLYDSVAFDDAPLNDELARSMLECAARCSKNTLCRSFNFIKSDEGSGNICELNRDRASNQHELIHRDNSMYWQVLSTQVSIHVASSVSEWVMNKRFITLISFDTDLVWDI